MDVLWAPWRLQYVKADKKEQADGCFICRYIAEQNDEENLVVLRTERTVTILNRFPYNNGHLLIAPLAHQGTLAEVADEDLLECVQTIKRMTQVMDGCLNPQGYNIGLNQGQIAGAGLPGHLHWHIVPRWSGDTNFMTVTSDATVIPQSLAALYEMLRDQLQNGS